MIQDKIKQVLGQAVYQAYNLGKGQRFAGNEEVVKQAKKKDKYNAFAVCHKLKDKEQKYIHCKQGVEKENKKLKRK